MKKHLLFGLLVASLSLAASATTVSINFSGKVTSVTIANGGPDLGFAVVGDTFAGTWTYDTAGSAIGPITFGEAYATGQISTLTLGGNTYEQTVAGSMGVFNDYPGIGDELEESSGFDISPAVPSGIFGARYGIAFRDTTGTLFNSTALPNSASLSQFDFAVLNLSWIDTSGDFIYNISGSITIPAKTVPEPASLTLLICGLITARGLRRRA